LQIEITFHENDCYDSKPTEMKKPPEIPKSKTDPSIETNIHTDEFFKDLEIVQRTQKPPSEDLISKLNQLASKPPFSYIHKVKKNDPL
jgi:hypothetical protein